MPRTRARTLPPHIGLCLAAALCPGFAIAGPLDPPAGAVVPTHKTLSEVEPRTAINVANTPGDADSLFKITQPGSYYLTGNITGVVGKHGVEIATSGVTLDLGGFDLAGVPAMGAFDGVSTSVPFTENVTVLNGSLRGWGDEGLDLSLPSNCRVEGVVASGNAGNGISVGSSSIVTNCAAHANTAPAGYGIFGGASCVIMNCAAYLNSGRGLFVSNGGVISHSASYQNGDIGILTSAGCTITACSSTTNGGDGFSINNNSTIFGCTAFNNNGRGIFAATGSLVADNVVRQNTQDGISATSACIIRGNACASNGNGSGDGAGIHMTLGDNRIEGNNCSGADRGIDVDAAGNFIVRNTCAGNTSNWEIAIGNSLGPIVSAGTNPAVISGNGASPSTLGSTDPNANYNY